MGHREDYIVEETESERKALSAAHDAYDDACKALREQTRIVDRKGQALSDARQRADKKWDEIRKNF